MRVLFIVLIIVGIQNFANAADFKTIDAAKVVSCIEEQVELSAENAESYTSEENDKLIAEMIEQCKKGEV